MSESNTATAKKRFQLLRNAIELFPVESHTHTLRYACGHTINNYTYYGKAEDFQQRIVDMQKASCYACFQCPPRHQRIYFATVIKCGDQVRLLDGRWIGIANKFPELIGRTVNEVNKAGSYPLARPL